MEDGIYNVQREISISQMQRFFHTRMILVHTQRVIYILLHSYMLDASVMRKSLEIWMKLQTKHLEK